MTLALFDLAGKRALVTGSTQGIGLALAGGLARAGARVVLNGRDPDRLAEVIERCDQRFQLGLNPAFKSQAVMYFRSLRAAPDHDRIRPRLFQRRAGRGQCVNQPYLGCREFAAAFRLVTELGNEPPPIAEATSPERPTCRYCMDDSRGVRPMAVTICPRRLMRPSTS